MKALIHHLRLFLILTRPAVILLLALCASLGLAGAGHPNDMRALPGVLVVVVAYLVFSVAVNDLADRQIDQVNLAGDHRRPLVVGTATPPDYLVVAIVAGAMTVAGASFLSWRALVVAVAGLGLSAAYSLPPLRLAKRGAVASLLLPIGYVAVPFLLGVFSIATTITWTETTLLAGLYLGFIGRMVLKDFRDVRGDTLFGKRTFLVRHGRGRAVAFSAVCMTVGIGLLGLVPGVTTTLRVTDVAILLTMLALLRALSFDRGRRRDEALISAIAILGRGLLVATYAHFALSAARWALWRYQLVLVLVAVTTVGQAVTMARNGPSTKLRVPSLWGQLLRPGTVALSTVTGTVAALVDATVAATADTGNSGIGGVSQTLAEAFMDGSA